MLRPYQVRCHEAAIEWMQQSAEPWLIEAITGAGKSWLAASIASEIHRISNKKVLVLQPSAELLAQNFEKFQHTGVPASIFSASHGKKSVRHPVVFGTPQSVKNSLARFADDYALVLIDEAHGITPTIKAIVDAMRARNPLLRVGGMTSTPYRLGSGYIYRSNEQGRTFDESKAKEPYFARRVALVHARELLDAGWLTPPMIGELHAETYETSALQLNRMGKFDDAAIDKAFVGQGRLTSQIVADVINQSRGRKGVMFFAATVKHAYEIMESLPPDLSRVVHGDMPKGERKESIQSFKDQRVKYIVNVGVLTTGFDAPHVDVIAILRATESVALLQQICGRGMRICDEKRNFLLLDYAGNIERHCPDGDLFSPEVRASAVKGERPDIEAKCPACAVVNLFSARDNNEGYRVDEAGYFIDLDGNRIMTDDAEPQAIPAHHGRRCYGTDRFGIRCDYRWSFKQCMACLHDNDIAARYCEKCKAEIIDPNAKLIADFKAMKKDPCKPQCDEVIAWQAGPTLTSKGTECIKIKVTTPYRSFMAWLHPNARHSHAQAQYAAYRNLNGATPKTIAYRKDPSSGFYSIISFNAIAQQEPTP